MAVVHDSPPVPALRLGAIHLNVTDLERSVAFYRDALGLRVQFVGATAIGLGAGVRELVVLHDQPGATQAAGHARMAHLALACPGRPELARALARLEAAGVPLSSSREHPTHSSLYLSDPDGNGLELTVDRPGPTGRLGTTVVGARPAPVDLGALRGLAGGVHASADPRTVVGHLHLLVGDVARAVRFYADGIGFTLVAVGDDEAYLAADGYHHHLGLGAWVDDATQAAPAASLGLRCWTVVLPSSSVAEAVGARLRGMGFVVRGSGGVLATRDPWGLGIALVPGAA